MKFCLAAKRDPRYFMTLVWALVLWRFADTETVQIGMNKLTAKGEGELVNAGLKRRMKLLAASSMAVSAIDELLQEEAWTIRDALETQYADFNTGIVLYEGCPNRELDTVSLLKELYKMDDEICDLMLISELGPGHQWQKCFLAYRTAVLSAGQAAHLMSSVTEAMKQIPENRTVAPKKVPMLSREQLDLIEKWNRAPLVPPTERFMWKVVHNKAVQQPEHVAIIAPDGVLTYKQLDEMSSQLAVHLQKSGVRPGELIPVCFGKGLDAIVAMLAINKAGGGFVPLDPSQPQNRLKAITRQLSSPLGLASPQYRQKLDDLGLRTIVVLSSTFSALPRAETATFSAEADPNAPAYCLFTSGSTGEPKGCIVNHEGFASITSHCNALHLGRTNRVLQFSSFSFGVALIEIWCTLATGGTLCIPSDSDRVNGLGNAIRSMGVDWSIMTPTVLATLVPDMVPDLKTILVAGEPIRKAQISLWTERTRLFQAYGFTEWAGICCVSPQVKSIRDIGVIGSPANARCWLVDPGNLNQLAPIGAVAELAVEGPSLAQGYLHNAEKTAANFVAPPKWRESYGRADCKRLYIPGDLVYYDSNGLLRYVSRKDRQVKIHGQRIDLAEPEYHITQACSAMRNVVVDAIHPADGDGTAILVAFVALPRRHDSQSGHEKEVETLFTLPDENFRLKVRQVTLALEDQLPAYMIPKLFLQLNAMPQTVTGKIDRYKLQKGAELLRHSELLLLAGVETSTIAPSTPNEVLIHQLVVELLKLSPEMVGMNHSFFSLGGNSVTAMRLVSLLRRVGLRVSVNDIFRSPRLNDLAHLLDVVDPGESQQVLPFSLLYDGSQPGLLSTAVGACRVAKSEVEDIYPCTPLQEGMMTLSTVRAGSYIAQFVYRLHDHVDATRFQTAWERTVQATPILRTRIISGSDGRMYQVVIQETFQWDKDAEHWQQYAQQSGNQHMLPGDRLTRAALLRESRGSSSTVFVLNMHHSVCDRWSVGLLMDRVEAAYTGQGLAINTMKPFLQYITQRVGADEYWKSQFIGLEAEVFPTLPSPDYKPRPAESVEMSVIIDGAIPGGHTASNMIRLAWALAISHYTGSLDVVFGVTVSGRAAPVADIERMIGPAIATVPLRCQINSNWTVLEALKAMQAQSLNMIPFEQMGLQHIRKLCREAEEACNFQSQLVVQPDWSDENGKLLTMCEADAAAESGFATYALSIICQLVGSSHIEMRAEFDPRVIPAPIMRKIVHHFDHVVHSLLELPDRQLANISAVSPGDVQLLRRWSGIVPSGCNRCVHDVIQQRFNERATYTAVWAWDGKLSYGELDELTNRLADHLVAQGIGAENIVPICLEKSYWTTVAMLGICRAGGAFVLLDPSLPEQRLRSICQQISSAVILTSQKDHGLAKKLAAHPIVLSRHESQHWPYRPGRPVPHLARADNALYVSFTSGSTGTPKGVVVEHRSFCSSAMALNKVTHVNTESRVLQFAAYSFDGCIMETLSTLMAGGCVCVPSDFERQNDLAKAAMEFNLTHAHLTPSVARHLLGNHPNITQTLVSVGEPMTPFDVANWAGNGKCKVMNGYGPAECAVSSTVQVAVTSTSDPKNIGTPLAAVCWVVHPKNHEILLPIGAVGELLIEGPTLARGYLNDPVKTAAVFIRSPSWLKDIRPAQPEGRLYKTGDLVRYNADGSFQYVGRRDGQVKLRGQRIELAEVEKHIYQCWPQARDVAVEMISPTRGTQTLVAFIVTNENGEHTNSTGSVLAAPTQEFIEQVAKAQMSLHNTIPAFMIPEAFLPLFNMPHTLSGKTDRRQLSRIAMSCTHDQLAAYGAFKQSQKRKPTSSAEEEMQAIWALVLNLPRSDIGVDDSFYQLGGDSIMAMQVVGQARSKGFAVTMDRFLRLKTIAKIVHALSEESLSPAVIHMAEEEAWHPLSPIQQMFFEQQADGWDQFSQIFVLRISEAVTISQLQLAIPRLVSKHSMLRARFGKRQDGNWHQIITSNLDESYSCHAHEICSRAQMDEVVSSSAQSLRIETGPLTAVDLMNMKDGSQYISISVHHLVVDLVSWRVLLADLEAVLTGGSLSTSHSVPFLTWCQLQREYSGQNLSPQKALPFRLPNNYYSNPSGFWGLDGHPNFVRDSEEQEFTLDEQTTKLLLGPANAAFATEPVEILHSALLYSFLKVFANRSAPLSFSEGHGRETWDPAIDLSQTVGWFTTMWPVVAEIDHSLSFLEVVRRIKDARRAVPSNGWAYFASRYLHPHGQQVFQQSHPVELIFNYAGQYQQHEKSGSLFVPEMIEYQGSLDAGKAIQRFGIFEVFACVLRGRLQFRFMYNRFMKHLGEIRMWVEACRQTLIEECKALTAVKPSRTLSDFPLLQLTYSRLQELISATLPGMGVSIENVEDIYPCSPSQRGMLIAQAKAPYNYCASVTWTIRSRNDLKPDVGRLEVAWHEVVKRHAILRTVFVDSACPESYMDQVVLRSVSPEVVFSKALGSGEVRSRLGNTNWPKGRCQHTMRFLERNSVEILGRLDLSHVIMDRTTLTILQNDLSLAYDGHLPPDEAPLYSGYISYIYRQDFHSAARYWQGYLQGVEPCEFPRMNHTNPPAGSEWGNMYRTFHERGRLEEFCRTYNVTTWNVAGLAWAMVLQSFTRTDSVCFGYVKSGRDLPIDGIADTAGPVFNPLPCRVHLGEALTVKEAVGKLQETYLQSLPHQWYPLSDIHRLAGVTNGALFNTSVAVQTEAPQRADIKRSLEFTIMAMEDGTEDDMVITLTPSDGVIELHLRYKSSTLATEQAKTVLATFEKAVRAIMENAGAPLASIDIFSDHDKEIIWSRNKQVPSPVSACVHDLIQRHAVQRPESPAVNAWDGAFTYRELDDLSSRLAVHLSARGVGPNVVVPLCFEKTKWTPVAIMGVLKAGGAFLLLDTSWPLQRLKDICVEVDSCLVVSSTTQEAVSRELAPMVVTVGDGCHQWCLEHESQAITRPMAQPADALYVVFTSGSTGKPKGIVIEHRSYCSGALDHIRAYNLTPQSRVLQFSSYAFDISIVEQLSVLIAGGCVCVISESQRKDNLAEAVSALQANHAMLIPSVARLCRHEDLYTIKSLSLAGECMQETDVAYWAEHVHLMNGYGPAECSGLSLIQPSVLPHTDPQNIGYPVGSVSWVVDPRDHNKLVPVGAVGELLIEGPIVGRGYINNPQKTAEAFINPPSWLRALRAKCDSRLYKTGDLVRANADGSLSILGRKDRQVKLRGQRLELGEVEANVQHCFVDAWDVVAEVITPAGSSKPLLVAMVLLSGDRADYSKAENKLLSEPSVKFAKDASEAENKLRQTVPNFMVPSIFIPLTRIPRTHSDKVDRNRLRDVMASISLAELQAYKVPVDATGNATQVPSTEEEFKLAEIWAGILKVPVESISASDNFLLRGGDSIDAMRAAAACRAAGMTLSVADIFAHPILSDLAKVLVPKAPKDSLALHQPFSLSPMNNPEKLYMASIKEGVIPSESALVDLLPATQAQNFFIERGTFHSYNFSIRGLLDQDRLREVCKMIMSRHSILRTKFIHYEGHLMQMVLGDFEPPFTKFNTNKDPLEFCKALWQTDLASLDFLGPLPVKFTLVSRSEEDHVFTIQVSHAQWDGVSIPHLFGDIATIYNQRQLPPTTNFSDYVYYRASRDENSAFQFWRQYLENSTMPTPFPPAKCRDEEHRTHWTFLDIRTPKLPAGVTMASLVKAACSFYLFQLLSQDDIVFGHTVNGRSLALDNVETLLGCCLNFIPLRVVFNSSWTVMDLLSHVQEQYTRTLPYEHLELSDIFRNSTSWPADTQLNFIVQHQNIELSHNIPFDGLQVQYSKFAQFNPLKEVWVFSEPHPDKLEIQSTKRATSAFRSGKISGDGIVIGPNAVRLISTWGTQLIEKILPHLSNATHADMLDHHDRFIVRHELAGRGKAWMINRGRLISILYEYARESTNIDIRLGSCVTKYWEDETQAGVIVNDCETLAADCVIFADGVHSAARSWLTGLDDTRQHSGWAAFRAHLTTEEIAKDPEASWVLQGTQEKDMVYVWFGDGINLAVSTLKKGKELAWVLIHKDHFNAHESWVGGRATIEDALATLRAWPGHSRPSSIIRHTSPEKLVDHPLIYRPPLKTWVSSGGRAMLIGDAAHPYLPVVGQGGGQAIEDGVVVATALELAGKGNTPLALRVAGKIRYPRATVIQLGSSTLQESLFWPDWEAVEKDPSIFAFPNPEWILGHDCREYTCQVFEQVVRAVRGDAEYIPRNIPLDGVYRLEDTYIPN
ncbi:hypothetical protein BJX96DRAFT_178400 [Aspergillus floccosus]